MILARRRTALTALMALTLMTMGSCTTAQKYTAIGAGVGAGTGALIAASSATLGGALIGGGVGAIAGYMIYKHRYGDL